MTHFLVRASGAPGTTAPVSATPPRSLYPLTIPHDRPTCHRNRHVGQSAFGSTRFLGELRKLGIQSVSRNTVKNILKSNGFDPGPKRGVGTWDEFLKIHAASLWQCDFYAKRVLTLRGFGICIC